MPSNDQLFDMCKRFKDALAEARQINRQQAYDIEVLKSAMAKMARELSQERQGKRPGKPPLTPPAPGSSFAPTAPSP